MNQELSNYLQNQISRVGDRLSSYIKDKSEHFYPKRHIYIKLAKYVNDFISARSEQRLLIVPGLRGVGKTTVLAQLYANFFLKNSEYKSLFISLDEAVNLYQIGLQEVLDGYEYLLGESFEKQKKPVFLFIDEIQADPNWTAVLKSIYDRSRNVFILCTGSSAVQLQTSADLARRATFEKLYPMSFVEYEMIKHNRFPIKGLKEQIKQAIYMSDSAQQVWHTLQTVQNSVDSYWSRIDQLDIKEYLSIGSLPFALQIGNEYQVYEAISIMLDKIISKDIPMLDKFDTDTLGVIKRLLFILSENDTTSINKLAPILNINNLTLSNIMDVLEKSELLIKVLPHGSNIGAVRKPAKYLFMSSAIRAAFFSIAGISGTFFSHQGRLFEDVAAEYLYREFVCNGSGTITYDSSQVAADFILQIANQRQIAIEVGRGEKDFSQIIATMEKIKCNYGIIFHGGSLEYNKEIGVIKVPWQYLLAM